MSGQGWPIRLIISCIILFNAILNRLPVHAADSKSELNESASVEKPSPEQDDAQIHTLEMVGDQLVWAAGDHGTIWKSSNGGKTWSFHQASESCSWKSICFLTNHRGWIAGSKVQPHTGLPSGRLMTTKDGGKTWKSISTKTLPPISYVKFFDLKSGIIIGQSNGQSPSGVLLTEDGGKNWTPITGKQNQNWLSASFTSPENGIVAGRNGSLSIIGSNRFLSTSPINLQNKAIHSIAINQKQTGWLVGDGGLILNSTSGGLDWKTPENLMPLEARQLFDFHSISMSENHIWIAGNPGSTIWHSSDQGHSWTKQSTPLTGTITSIAFSSPTHGCAAGSLGTIIHTDDGGKTWQAVRAAKRRIAIMGIYSEPEQIPFELLVKLSKDQGYRSHIFLPIHNKLRPEHRVPENDHLLLESAITSAGGSNVNYGWQFNIEIPGLEFSTNKLLKHWQEQTDYQFREQFIGRLVRDIRNWKPSVIVINHPNENDASTKIIHQAVQIAAKQAKDKKYFPDHLTYASLSPWKVEKIIEKTVKGNSGSIKIPSYKYLKHAGKNTFEISSSARSQITSKKQNYLTEISFNVIQASKEIQSKTPNSIRFFTGIPIAPGTDSRRELSPIDESELERQLKIARKQKNFRTYTKKFLDNPRHASQVIGQLHQMTNGMSNQQAALQILQLAHTYRSQGNWELYESTLIDVVTRFPHEPVTVEGMKSLLHLWSGFEPSWQRIQKYKSHNHQLIQNVDQIDFNIRQARSFSDSYPNQYQADFFNKRKKAVELASHETSIKIGRSTLKERRMLHWQQQAFRLTDLIRNSFPQVYIKPEIQFPLAKLLRNNDQSEFAEHFYNVAMADQDNQSWNNTAAAEIWLASSNKQTIKNVYKCMKTERRPFLDGLLSDECWVDAKILSLDDEETFDEKKRKKGFRKTHQDHAFIMMTYDDEYLFLAYSIPHHHKLKQADTIESGRIYDANLSGFDRIHLDLDIDRDYSTWYSFKTDQRGQTSDACWNNHLWNPKWHVKTFSSETHWRTEIAIPFSEITDTPPTTSTTWAASYIRIIPGIGIESWSHPSTIEPSPSNFGLIRFQ